MNIRLIGAVLIICSCGGVGFRLCAAYRAEGRLLRQLYHALQWMECALGSRAPDIPQLLEECAKHTDGELSRLFLEVAAELEQCTSADAGTCLEIVLNKYQQLPIRVRQLLNRLGSSLGSFDLDGQLRQLGAVRKECGGCLDTHTNHRQTHNRTVQTLGLCAGFALAILLL